MSTSYYLVQTEPTLVYGRAKIAQTSGGKTRMWPYDPMNGWAYADGGQLFAPDLTVPKTVADLKALVPRRPRRAPRRQLDSWPR